MQYQIRIYIETVNTPPWSRSEIYEALKGLQCRKSRDPPNMTNKLFDSEVAGNDLIDAIGKLINRIKTDLIYPKCF